MKQNRFSRASEKMSNRIIAAYGRGLAKVLNHPWLTLSVALSTLLLSVLLWVFIPKGFFPVQDNGIIQGTLGTAIQLLPIWPSGNARSRM